MPWFALLLVAASEPDPVVVKVADRDVLLSEVQTLLDGVHPAQASAFTTVEQFIDLELVPSLLFDLHAARRDNPPELIPRGARDTALARGVERQLLDAITVSEAEIASYYNAHRERFHRDPAILVWRIVTPNLEQASDILDQVRRSPTAVDLWSRLARQHSVDDATRMRHGSLGFVRADGHTDVAQVRVSPDVFQAVAPLKDGELLGEPLAFGEHFAVLWRRGSKPARDVSLGQARDQIASVITRRKASDAVQRVLATLREQHLKTYDPAALELIDYRAPDTARPKRSPSKTHAAEASPRPSQTLRGDR